MNVNIRPATQGDIRFLYNLDLKSYETPPAPGQWWHKLIEAGQSSVCVVTHQRRPIGVIAWEKQPINLPGIEAKVSSLHIYKLCVLEKLRRRGVGSMLLTECYKSARARCCPYLSMTIPSFMCEPEGDASKWLNNRMFEAKMILPDPLELYGREYDQYLFVFELGKKIDESKA